MDLHVVNGNESSNQIQLPEKPDNMGQSKPILYLLLLFSLFLWNTPAYSQIQQINKELHKLSSIKDSVSMVNSLNRLGTLYRTRNADSSFYYGIKAKRIATNVNYRQGQADADLVIAYALFRRGLYAESLEMLGKVLPYYQKLDDSEKIVRVYLDMLEVENKGISDRTKIISLLQKAIQAGKKLEKDSIMSEAYISYINRGPDISDDSIAYYLSKSTEIANKYNDERILNYIQLWQARLLILDGQLEEALPLVKKIIEDSQRNGNPSLEINALFLITGFYENEPKKVLGYFYEAFKVAQASREKDIEIYILNYALEVAKQLGDKDEIIKIYSELDKSMTADWENSKKFMGDYVRYNSIEQNNKLLGEENARRTMWIVIISFMALISLMTIYLIMLRRSRKAKERIEILNNTANLQIIAMEEAKHEAVREEQQRLGQDLHDGLSSSIASIKHQLETLALDTKDTSLKKKLAVLLSELTSAYAVARNKSHEWFYTGENQQHQTFEQRIRLLTDAALPGSNYDKAIHIDEHALKHANMDTRIALLRIIQEAITNILKHAKAQKVDILIYEESASLILTIKDNGKGLGSKKPTGGSSIGLQSIKRRVEAMDGEIEIASDTKGTEIAISIPLKST
ncbi:sensor histidine kinase [Algoriphagus sp. NG3]|uniref:sensor histidine kinase n=1 Tax=Algoriphagus sp. NG3 TaxID=3097546 RepID=UPI002A8402B5|nr:ATP-binding protein [Algoriphagus sp. NG3]WPR77756.1 ATP-binding protein [Algoriphagus sp. NG3]